MNVKVNKAHGYPGQQRQMLLRQDTVVYLSLPLLYKEHVTAINYNRHTEAQSVSVSTRQINQCQFRLLSVSLCQMASSLHANVL